jgi:hypothetical protein
MRTRLEATPAFRRGILALALGLAVAEAVGFVLVWRLGLLLEPGADRRAAIAFVLLGTTLTLQAMGVVGFAWMLVAQSRTVAEFDDEELALEHPWRRWSGGWSEVRHAWLRGGWLTVEIAGTVWRWYLRVPAESRPGIERLKDRLQPGAWLEGPDLTRHLLARVLPPLLGATGLGGLALLALLRYLQQALG